MIRDYNILKDDTGYFVYCDRYQTLNNTYDWNSAHYEEYDGIKLYVGPSGFLVDIDFDRNQINYDNSRMQVSRKATYDFVEKPYNINSIIYDSQGNLVNFDEWVFEDDPTVDGGAPYFSKLIVNVNDKLDEYNAIIEQESIPKVSTTINNSNVFPPIGTLMNLKTNKPVVKAENSVTRKEVKTGTVIKVK